MGRECSAPGCASSARTLGWCHSHYMRWRRNGDPLAGRDTVTARGAAQRYVNEVVMAYDGDECLIWPFARDEYGYGRVSDNGRSDVAHRVICKRTHGPAPTPKHQAAHSCGKGHEGCVTKRHLDWKTRKENEADKILHGTAPRGENNHFAKLTTADVEKIRAQRGQASQRKIAADFGIDQSTVSDILSGRAWKEQRI